jgi:hypothetical protein
MLKASGCTWPIVLLWGDHLFQEISAHTRYVGARFIYVGLCVYISVAVQYLLGRPSRKQQPPGDEVEEEAPQAEDVRFVAEDPTSEDIWVHIARCTAFHQNTFFVSRPASEPQISETHLELLLIKNQNVLGLYISVHNLLTMHEINSEEKLLHDLSDLGLRNHLLLIYNEVSQAAIFRIFKD